MAASMNLKFNGPFVNREFLARTIVIVFILAALFIPLNTLANNDRMEIHARSAQMGGWRPDIIRAGVNQPLQLRLTSDDVVHGFGIGLTDFESVEIQPGKWTEVNLSFDEPGVYTYYCTRWCGIDHWRMRGTIEVGDPSLAAQVRTSPLYVTLGLDIDAPHLSPVLPDKVPVATEGERLLASRFESLTNQMDFSVFQSTDYYRSHSPHQLFEDLRQTQLMDAQRWVIVAAIWKSNATPGQIAEGRQLFSENCAACHGQSGAGDGVFADELAGQEIHDQTGLHGFKQPANLHDPGSILGASPALLQGKILRGGMGTGMPMWGAILTESQIWNLIAYIYSLQFGY